MVRDPAVEFAVLILVVCSTVWVGRVLCDARHGEGFAVVKRGVAAAVMDSNWMICRYLVEILCVERAIVLQFCVVEEIAFDPGTRRRGEGASAQFADDALDGDEFDIIRIADEYVIEQPLAAAVIVGIDEAGNDRHLLGVIRLGFFAGETLYFIAVSHGDEAAALDREGLGLGGTGIDGVDFGVEDDEIRVLRICGGGLRLNQLRIAQPTTDCAGKGGGA